MGWQWLGRLRNTTYLKPVTASDVPGEWVSCKAMYALATRRPRDFGLMDIARSNPLTARVVLHAKPPNPKHQKYSSKRSNDGRHCNEDILKGRGQSWWHCHPTLEFPPYAHQSVHAQAENRNGKVAATRKP